MTHDQIQSLIYVGFWATTIICGAICAFKGKWATLVGGLLFMPLLIVGAIRLAKPLSLWASWFYHFRNSDKSVRAWTRYGYLPSEEKLNAWRREYRQKRQAEQ
jgi:hypothetical protein